MHESFEELCDLLNSSNKEQRHYAIFRQCTSYPSQSAVLILNIGSGSHENSCPCKVIAMEKEGQTRIMHEQGFGERECFANKPS